MYSEEASKGFVLASSFFPNRPATAFRGIAFTDQDIIIGPEGFQDYTSRNAVTIGSLNDGRFTLFLNDGDLFWAKCDSSGQDILYYYSRGQDWAVSNSFYMLAAHLKEKGARLTVDEECVKAFFINHTLGQQLVSHRTMVQEIMVLPIDQAIKVQLAPNHLGKRLTLVPCYDARNEPAIDAEAYRDGVEAFCLKWASRLHCLVEYYKGMEAFDLSGGVDSRLNLSLLTASGYDVGNLNLCSNAGQARDYEVAQQVAAAVGARIQNRKLPSERMSGKQTYKLWKLGNLGIYSPVYCNTRSNAETILHVHGAGGGCFRQVYRKTPKELGRMMKNKFRAGGIGNAFATLMGDAFKEMKHDMSSHDGMLLHYRYFRSRFHFGRNGYRSLSSVLVTPLSSPDLMFATRYLSDEERNRNQLALDIILLTNPKLAEIEFDSERKNFSRKAMESSLFYREKPISPGNLQQYSVYARAPRAETQNEGAKSDGFLTHLRRDLETFYAPVLDRRLVEKEQLVEAAAELEAEGSLSKRARGASRIISAGEVLALCGQI